MRIRLFAILVLLATGTASAAGYTLGAQRHMESAIMPDGVARFVMPLHVETDGQLYAKLLATPDNAATSEPGWSVGFAIERDAGKTDMGVAVVGEPSALVPVTAGEDASFVVDLRPPSGTSGEPRVYVALAFRAPDAGASGSGASMDEARALSLTLRPPPASQDAPEPPAAMPPSSPPRDDVPAGEAGGAAAESEEVGEARGTPASAALALAGLALAVLARRTRS